MSEWRGPTWAPAVLEIVRECQEKGMSRQQAVAEAIRRLARRSEPKVKVEPFRKKTKQG